MSKILSIDNDIITIGMDGGTLKEVRAVDLNFVPHVNDEVEIFETETKTIVSKLEKSSRIHCLIRQMALTSTSRILRK